MTTYTARAFNATNGAIGHTINGGASFVHTALNDSNNATSVTLAPASGGKVRCGVTGTPLAEGQSAVEFAMTIRMSSDANYPANVIKVTFWQNASSLYNGIQVGPTLYQGISVSAVNENYLLTVNLAQYPDLLAALPYLTVELALAVNYGGNITLVNVDPSIGYVSNPSVNGPYVTNNIPLSFSGAGFGYDYYKPTFSWDFVDSDGDKQAAFQFLLTTVNTSGSQYDPYDSSYTIIEDSGIVYSANAVYKSSSEFVYSTTQPFSCWVRVAQKNGTALLWSKWAKSTPTFELNTSASFTNYSSDTNKTTIAAPEITTAVDDVNGKVTLTLNNVTNLLPECGSNPGGNPISPTGYYWISDPTRASTVTAWQLRIFKSSVGTGDVAAKTHITGTVIDAKGYYPVLASRSYKFQAIVDPQAVSKTLQFEVTWYDASGTIIGSVATAQVTTGTSIATQSANFTSPSNARFATLGLALIGVPQNANAYFRNIYFGLNVGTIDAPFCASNGLNKLRVTDADLPGASAYSWTSRTNANFVISDVTFTSPLNTSYLLIKGTATGFVYASTNMQYRCLPNTSYIFSSWVGIVNSASFVGEIEYGIEWYSDYSSSILSTNSIKITSNTTVTRTFTSPANAKYFRIFTKFTTNNTNAGFAIDQVYFALSDSTPYAADNITRIFERGVGRLANAADENCCAGGTIVQVQRGPTASGPWTDVIGTNKAYSYWNQAVISDYAVAPTGVYYYRARTIVQDSGREVISSWTVTGSVTMGVVPSPNTGKWVLKDPVNGTRLILDVVDDGNGFTYTVEEDQARFNPLGRNRVVVVRDVIRGARINLVADFLTLADFTTFNTLRALQRTLLLQKYDGSQWFISIDSDAAIEEQNTTPVRRFVRLSATEVNVPTV